MKAIEFFNIVTRMREKQKEYFRFRTTSALNESKQLEKEVDAEIERVQEIMRKRQNPTIW